MGLTSAFDKMKKKIKKKHAELKKYSLRDIPWQDIFNKEQSADRTKNYLDKCVKDCDAKVKKIGEKSEWLERRVGKLVALQEFIPKLQMVSTTLKSKAKPLENAVVLM